MDHTVCVDGQRRLVWDKEETYPLELSSAALRMCCSAKGKHVMVQVMKLVKQREKKTEIMKI